MHHQSKGDMGSSKWDLAQRRGERNSQDDSVHAELESNTDQLKWKDGWLQKGYLKEKNKTD